MVLCPEEIAYHNRWISTDELSAAAKKYEKTHYGKYLKKLTTLDLRK